MPYVSFILPAYKNLKEVVDAFSDSRISYFRNSENMGSKSLAGAWNAAMRHARGEWCVLASDDDVYSPRFLEVMLGLLRKYPDCDLAHARVGYIDADGQFVRIGEQRVEFETQVQFAYSRGVARFAQCAPDFIFRRTALEGIGGFVDFPLAWYSDDATWMMLSKNGVACSSELLFFYRLSGQSITTKSGYLEEKVEAAEMFRDWFRVYATTLLPQTEEDRLLAKDIVRAAEKKLNCNLEHEMRYADNVFQWIRVISKTRVPRMEKLKFAARKYRIIGLFGQIVRWVVRLICPSFR